MKLGLFVTGTDTGIGKTFVSSLLISALKTYRIRHGYFKPIQTGLDSDTETVSGLTAVDQSKSSTQVFTQFSEPTYFFPKPLAPNRAAESEGKQIQLDSVIHHWNQLEERAWVVEGAGGLLVPLNAKQTMRDLVQALGLRLLVVASTRLGTINHTLLTLESAKSVGISVVGIVLVGPDDPGLSKVLEDFSGVPVIAKIPHYSVVSPALVEQQGVMHFSASVLRLLYD